jgi:hypothetical protein
LLEPKTVLGYKEISNKGGLEMDSKQLAEVKKVLKKEGVQAAISKASDIHFKNGFTNESLTMARHTVDSLISLGLKK